MTTPEKIVQMPTSDGPLKAQKIVDKLVPYDPALGLMAAYPNKALVVAPMGQVFDTFYRG